MFSVDRVGLMNRRCHSFVFLGSGKELYEERLQLIDAILMARRAIAYS